MLALRLGEPKIIKRIVEVLGNVEIYKTVSENDELKQIY